MKVTVDRHGTTFIGLTDLKGQECHVEDREFKGQGNTLLLGTDRAEDAGVWVSQDNVRELLPYLTRFAETGRLSEQPAEKSEVKK